MYIPNKDNGENDEIKCQIKVTERKESIQLKLNLVNCIDCLGS